jgi:hypothetical protein
MSMPKRDEELFAHRPGEVPNWMKVRDEDNKRREKIKPGCGLRGSLGMRAKLQ